MDGSDNRFFNNNISIAAGCEILLTSPRDAKDTVSIVHSSGSCGWRGLLLFFSRRRFQSFRGIKKTGLARCESTEFVAEKVGLGFALAPAFDRVAIEGVIGDRFGGFARRGEVRFELSLINRTWVVHEIGQVVGVAALARLAEQDHGFARGDPPAAGLVLVDHRPGAIKRLDLVRDDASTILGTDGEEAAPEVLAVFALEKFD